MTKLYYAFIGFFGICVSFFITHYLSTVLVPLLIVNNSALVLLGLILVLFIHISHILACCKILSYVFNNILRILNEENGKEL